MSEKRKWDLTSVHSLESGAEWLRTNADAICVLVIRAHDSVLAVDPRCKPEDAEQLVTEYVPRLASQVEHARSEKRKAARLELERCPE